MKKIIILSLTMLSLWSCKDNDTLETEIENIEIDFAVERFDRAYANATTNDLENLKDAFPFLFSKHVPDSVWVARINDTLQVELLAEVNKKFSNFNTIENELTRLFQHLKYYDKTFRVPRVITLTNDVDYRDKVIVTDTIVLIALDNYLGPEHPFYGNIPRYITQNMNAAQVVSDVASKYAEGYVFQSQKKTLLDDMIYFGKQLYFKDMVIPFKTDEEKIGYTPEQLEFAQKNEGEIWTNFIENEYLYSTDSSLPGRFIADAPFSKFYLELDRESPGRLGQYIGWQIVRTYMKRHDVSLMDMMEKEAIDIFNTSNYKPPK